MARILEMWGMKNELSTATVDLLSQLLQMKPDDRLSIDQVVDHAAFFTAASAVTPSTTKGC